MWLAEPSDPCSAMTGPAKQLCERGENGGRGGGGGGADAGDPLAPLDPLEALAKNCGEAAGWVARKVGDLVDEHASVDLTDPAFLRQYALVFAASTILVLLLWLLAVAKRAVRGVPASEAIGEAIGLLWLSVLVSAFAPLALYVVIQAVGAITDVLSDALGGGSSVFDALAKALEKGELGGGPIILIVVSLLSIFLCGGVGLLLVLRTLGLYVGALLGLPIFAGLVDKDLWGHLRKWTGIMAGIIGVEPVLIIVIGLSGAVQSSDDIVLGLGITAIALIATVALITRVPGWGDSVRLLRSVGRGAGSAAGVVLGGGGAAAGVHSGIQTHSNRGPGRADGGERVGASSKSSGGQVSGGMAAHSERPPRPSKPGDGTPKSK